MLIQQIKERQSSYNMKYFFTCIQTQYFLRKMIEEIFGHLDFIYYIYIYKPHEAILIAFCKKKLH